MSRIPRRDCPIRPAAAPDLDWLGDWCRSHSVLDEPRRRQHERTTFAEWLADGCVLLARDGDRIRGAAALDIDRGSIGALALDPRRSDRALTGRLLAALERLAARYEIDELAARVAAADLGRFASFGYRETARERHGHALIRRSLARRRTSQVRRVRLIRAELGIPPDYARWHRLPVLQEARQLVPIGADLFGREQKLAPAAARAWHAMQHAAAADGVVLQLVSAFRSVDYQRELVRRKLARGLTMTEVLRTSAAPGFSEHHTGRAVDVTTPGSATLEESFEHTTAFDWLTHRAAGFGFRLSFPRGNRHAVAYEPWHWCHRGRQRR